MFLAKVLSLDEVMSKSLVKIFQYITFCFCLKTSGTDVCLYGKTNFYSGAPVLDVMGNPTGLKGNPELGSGEWSIHGPSS